MAKSNIATFAYRTRTVCSTEINDYLYYYGGGGGHRYHRVWEEPAVATGQSTANQR
jgi:hypothetical protein